MMTIFTLSTCRRRITASSPKQLLSEATFIALFHLVFSLGVQRISNPQLGILLLKSITNIIVFQCL